MNILFAVHGYKPAWRVGGPILSVSALAEGLVRRGHAVTVFTTNANLDEDLDVPVDRAVDVAGVEVWYFRREEWVKKAFPWLPYLSKSMGFLYAPAMADALERRVPGVDVVHTHLPFVYPTWAAGRAAARHRKPLFYHQRGVFDPARLRFRSLKKALFIATVEKPTMRAATTLIALTDAEAESYRALGIDTPCRVVPNGIDVAAYEGGEATRANARWNLTPDDRVILFLGRLHPIKGADRLLKAFRLAAARMERSVLVLAGPDEWSLEAKFREASGAAGLRDRVRFPGMVSGREKIDLLARADLFALPSDAEGFSMAVLEALASRTAVLLSPGCHFAEVEAAGAGRVVSQDPDALADALVDLLTDGQRLIAMGERGRMFVRAQYSWDRVTETMVGIYEEGIERVKTSGRVHAGAAAG
jgi:glycosyltransferase involved in cell wall biosynthesis